MSDLRLRLIVTLARCVIFLVDETTLSLQKLRRNRGLSQPPLRHSLSPQSTLIPALHGHLDARLCIPPNPLAAVLICHGIGDRLSYWEDVQVQLAAFGMASLIFDYASYGNSTGSFSVQALREDTKAAYTSLRSATPGLPVFLLGFSMGTGVAADAVPSLLPPPAGLILCQPFVSFRAAAAEITHSRLLARIVPDVWKTVAYLPSLPIPLLIVHSDADRLLPLAHAETLYAASDQTKSWLSVPHGFSHPGGYLNPTLAYWDPILNFIKRHMH